MRRPILTAALAIAALLPLAAAAQPGPSGVPDLSPGARVRLTAPAIEGEFHVLDATRDTLVVQRQPGAPVHRVAVGAIQRLDVSRGRRSAMAGFGRGFLIGAGIGAVTGAVSGFADGDDDDASFFSMSAEAKALGGGLFLGLGGGLVGGVVGLGVRGERWERVVAAPRVALVAPPAGRGIGVRVAGAF